MQEHLHHSYTHGLSPEGADKTTYLPVYPWKGLKYILSQLLPEDLTSYHPAYNLHIIEVPEGEEREKGAESLFKETMTENFLNLGKERDIKTQEYHKV